MNFYGPYEIQEMWRAKQASENRDRLNGYVGSNKQKQRGIKRKKGKK